MSEDDNTLDPFGCRQEFSRSLDLKDLNIYGLIFIVPSPRSGPQQGRVCPRNQFKKTGIPAETIPV